LTVPIPSCETKAYIEKLKEYLEDESSLKRVWELSEKAEERRTKRRDQV
jgi:hypothetical protein